MGPAHVVDEEKSTAVGEILSAGGQQGGSGVGKPYERAVVVGHAVSLLEQASGRREPHCPPPPPVLGG